MRLHLALLGAALLAALSPVTAGAAGGPPIDWDPAYCWQVGGTYNNLPSGGQFQMVGIISAFGEPFTDLNAGDPSKEYTFYVHGLISQGTGTDALGTQEYYTTNYTGGTIEIYEDTSPDASFSPGPPLGPNIANFTDGTLILSGSFTSFTVESNNNTLFKSGNIEGDLVWTGGTLLAETYGAGGSHCPGLLVGGSTWTSSVVIPGYIFRHFGKLDIQCPVPTRNPTWGRIKQLYR